MDTMQQSRHVGWDKDAGCKDFLHLCHRCANVHSPKSWAPLPAPSSTNSLSSTATHPPFPPHFSLVGLHTWVSHSLSLFMFLFLSLWCSPLQAPLTLHCTMEPPAAAQSNLTRSETATSKHLNLTLNHTSTSPFKQTHTHTTHEADAYVILYLLIWLICSFGKWLICVQCCAHKSQNKSQLVLVVVHLNTLKHNLTQLGK